MKERASSKYWFPFEKLETWKRSKELVITTYQICEKMPPSELYGLRSQMQRASVSVASNLAEGSGRRSLKDQARFTSIAYSSLLELLNQVIIAADLDLITEADYWEFREEVKSLSRMIIKLERYQRSES